MNGLSINLQDISDSKKITVRNNVLKKLNVDIAALQETRRADSYTLKEMTTRSTVRRRVPISPESID